MFIYGLRKLAIELFWAALLLLGGVGCGGVGGIPAGASPNNAGSVSLPMPSRPISLLALEQLTMFYRLGLPTGVGPDIAIDPAMRWLILKNSTQLLFYDLNTLQDTGLRINCPQPCLMAFHPEPTQNQLLVGNRLYDLSNFATPFFVYESPAGHTPTAVAYNHDGSQLAIAYSSQLTSQIHIYRQSDHKSEATIPLSGNTVSALAFNHDSTLIAASTNNNLETRAVATVCLLASCPNFTQPTNSPIKSLIFYSPERGSEFLITNQGAIWQVTQTKLQLFKSIESGHIALSPINSLLVVASRSGMKAYDLATASLEAYPLLKQTVSSSNPTVRFSPDGGFLVIGVNDENGQSELQIWGGQGLLPLVTIPANTSCRQGDNDSVLVTFSADGQRLARSIAHCLEIWDVARPEAPTLIVNKPISDGLIYQLLVQPNGQELAVIIHKNNGDEIVFPISDSHSHVRLPHQGSIVDMIFLPTLPDGTQILATLEKNPAGQQIIFWDWQSNIQKSKIPITDVQGIALAVTSDNHLIMATTNGQLKSWLINNGRMFNPDLLGTPSSSHFHDAIYLPNQGPIYLTESETGLFRLKANNEMQISTTPFQKIQEAASCSMDSQYVGIISDCQLWVWHTAEGQDRVVNVLRMAGECLKNVAFNPADSHTLSTTAQSGRLYLWNLSFEEPPQP